MSWGTVTLADEPLELLLAFAAWHRYIGAREIHIFLDRPSQKRARALLEIPGVQVTPCDEEFWEAQGGRPGLQTKRQTIVANLAYARARVDWLAHVDADEFLLQNFSLEEELAAIPEPVDAAVFPVRERVWEVENPPTTIFDGVFRKPIPGRPSLNRYLSDVNAKFLMRGIASHTQGKSILRTGRNISVGIHTPLDHEQLVVMESQSTRLLHFDGVTPFHWLTKRLRYATLPHAEEKSENDGYRWAQIAELREFGTLWEARRFQSRLTAMRPQRLQRMRALGLVSDYPNFRPKAALKELLPERSVNLSVKLFDRRISRRDEAFLAGLSLTPPPQAANED